MKKYIKVLARHVSSKNYINISYFVVMMIKSNKIMIEHLLFCGYNDQIELKALLQHIINQKQMSIHIQFHKLTYTIFIVRIKLLSNNRHNIPIWTSYNMPIDKKKRILDYDMYDKIWNLNNIILQHMLIYNIPIDNKKGIWTSYNMPIN